MNMMKWVEQDFCVFNGDHQSNKYSQEGEPDKGLVHGGVVAQGDGVVREVELGGEEGHLVFIYSIKSIYILDIYVIYMIYPI